MQKGLAVTATVVSAILIVIFVGITILGLADWNRFRPLIGDLSERITGRRLSIRGDLNGGLGFVPWVEAKDVTLANADWAASPMVEVGYVRLEWPFFENLVGVKKVRHLTVRDAKVRLARSRAGTPNWQLSRRRPAGAAPKKVPFTMPIFEDLLLENVEISLEDQRSGGTWTLSVARLSADDGRKPGRIEARGKLDDAPFRLVGNYDAHGDTLSVPRFEAALGRSQATGHLVILTGKRPNVDANLRFSELWLEDFLRLLPERPKKPRAGLFPDAPLDFEALLAFDGSVRFHAERFIGSGVAELITAIELRADLRGGRLRIDPMAIALAGGDLRGEVIFDVSRSPYETAVDLELDSVSLEEIGKAYGGKLPTKQLDPKNLATGLLHGTVELITAGRSAREFAGSIDGDIRLTIEDGSLGSVFVEALDLDLAESVTSWIAGNPTTPIRCMLVDLGAEKGVLETRTMLLATGDTNLVGSGTIDLREEKIDLVLEARQKDFSPAAGDVPIHIEGSLARPAVRPDAALAAKAGAAGVIGAVAPPLAAILPFVEVKATRRESVCAKYATEIQGVIEKAKEATGE